MADALRDALAHQACAKAHAGSDGPCCLHRLGIDIVDMQRVVQSLQTLGARFEERLFTAGERAYANSAQDGAGGDAPLGLESLKVQRLAARFAAKEAAIKALSFSDVGVDWREIEVRQNADRGPDLVLHGRALALATQAGVDRLLLSLTHDGAYAAAVVAALSDKTREMRSPE